MHVLPIALSHDPSPSRAPVCRQLIAWQLRQQLLQQHKEVEHLRVLVLLAYRRLALCS